MHIKTQVVKKGRRRKRNSERIFDNFSENDMVFGEFKYDFKNKNFLQQNKHFYKDSQKTTSGNIFFDAKYNQHMPKFLTSIIYNKIAITSINKGNF